MTKRMLNALPVLAAAIVAGVVDSFATKMLGKIRVDDEGESVFQHNTYARRR